MIKNLSPDVELSTVKINNQKIFVVRDDYLQGGTKQRAAIPFLNYYKEKGIKEFCYASPFSGFAQIALAISANICGVKSRIFAEHDPKTKSISEFSIKALKYSKVDLFDSLFEASKASIQYATSNANIMEIPLGFDDEIYKTFLIQELQKQWDIICKKINFVPKRIWLPLGSGTLIRSFRKFLPSDIQVNCVNVNILDKNDKRIINVKNLNNINYFESKLLFEQKCDNLPPIPSNPFYDAKLWDTITSVGLNGDLWWNVAY